MNVRIAADGVEGSDNDEDDDDPGPRPDSSPAGSDFSDEEKE